MADKAQQIEFLLSQVRADGVALTGGTATFYEAGTTTLKTVWTDRGKTTPAANPYTLDANATAQLYGDGLYKVVIKNSSGVTKYTRDNVYFKSADRLGVDIADYASLTAAVSAIGSTPATLHINSATTCTANTTIPSTLGIVVTKGGSINQGSYTLTINGPSSFGRFRVFTGTGTVTFGVGATLEVVPEWWGAVADGSTDCATAINAAISAVTTSGGDVHLGDGTYKVAAYLTLKSNVTLRGNGDASIIKGVFGSAVNRIITSPTDVLQNNITIKNLKVDRTGTNAQHGIILGGINHLRINNVSVYGKSSTTAGAMGISPFDEFAAIQSTDVVVENCRIEECNNFGIAFGNVKGGVISNNQFVNCYREAIGLEAWGEGVGIVEGVIVANNTLLMSEAASNHIGGSAGPALLVGGATSKGITRYCQIKNNLIIISDNVATSSYVGIYAIGYDVSNPATDIDIEGNTIVNASGAGIYVGALGQVTQKIRLLNNTIIDANAGASSSSAIIIRNGQYVTIAGNVVSGTAHVYAVEEQTGANYNTVYGNRLDTGTSGFVLFVGANSSFDVPTTRIMTGGAFWQEQATVADDGTYTFSSRQSNSRGISFFTCDFSAAYAILIFNGTAAPTVVSKSGDVVVGATNPDTDGALNIWPASASTVSIKNRLGSSRVFVYSSINPK